MSVTSFFSNAVHTFVNWFEKEISAIEGNAPTIETYIEKGVTYSTEVLKIVLSQVEAGSPAASIITKAIQDILTLGSVAYDAGAHPTLGGAFQAIATNLGALETATGVKNTNTIATVGKVVSTIAAIAQAVLAIVPVAA